jgi:hypothetical protein
MALLVIDDSSVSIGKAPNNGFVMNLTDIRGLPEGLTIMVPFEGAHAQEVYEGVGVALGLVKKVEVANPADMANEVNQSGLNSSK